MLLPDVNVLVYAHREDAVDHPRYRGWLQDLLASDSAYGISESGCEWVTTDRDYARFTRLAWRHPLVERAGPPR